LQPDGRIRERLARGLAGHIEQYGQPFCPCKRHYPLDIRLDPVCPCPEAASEIARDGRCECGMFIDAAAIAAKVRPGLLATITCPG